MRGFVVILSLVLLSGTVVGPSGQITVSPDPSVSIDDDTITDSDWGVQWRGHEWYNNFTSGEITYRETGPGSTEYTINGSFSHVTPNGFVSPDSFHYWNGTSRPINPTCGYSGFDTWATTENRIWMIDEDSDTLCKLDSDGDELEVHNIQSSLISGSEAIGNRSQSLIVPAYNSWMVYHKGDVHFTSALPDKANGAASLTIKGDMVYWSKEGDIDPGHGAYNMSNESVAWEYDINGALTGSYLPDRWDNIPPYAEDNAIVPRRDGFYSIMSTKLVWVNETHKMNVTTYGVDAYGVGRHVEVGDSLAVRSSEVILWFRDGRFNKTTPGLGIGSTINEGSVMKEYGDSLFFLKECTLYKYNEFGDLISQKSVPVCAETNDYVVLGDEWVTYGGEEHSKYNRIDNTGDLAIDTEVVDPEDNVGKITWTVEGDGQFRINGTNVEKQGSRDIYGSEVQVTLVDDTVGRSTVSYTTTQVTFDILFNRERLVTNELVGTEDGAVVTRTDD